MCFPICAAQGPAAGAQTAQHLGFVAHADLPHFDAGVVLPDQHLDQFPEIHPVFCGKVEDHLGAVKEALHVRLRLHPLPCRHFSSVQY